MKLPPKPKKIEKKIKTHGDERIDNYFWLRDDERQNKDVIDYLKKENKYSDNWFKVNKVDSNKIFQKYKNALPKFEEGFKTKIDGYQYFSTASASQEYRKYYRIFKNKKKLILDVNKLAKNKNYFSISSIFPSRNHKYLAYGKDESGRRIFSITVRDIKKNKNLENNLCSSTGEVIWNKSSDGYFYLKKDPVTLITNSLYFHRLGTKKIKDILIYNEKDSEFNLSISLSRTKKYLFLQTSKTESNEIWFLDLNDENFNLKCFLKRKKKHLYYIDDTPEDFYILSNRKNNKNFALYKTNFGFTSEKYWKILISHKKNELIEDFLCFKDFIILETRKNGITQLIQFNKKNKQKIYIEFKDKAYTVNLSNNNRYEANFFSFIFSSLKTPSTIFSQNLYTKKRRMLWKQKIVGHKENKYETKRISILARDGTKVPISLIYKKGLNTKKAPLLQYGYGSYGLVVEPSFKLSFMPLVDEGFIFAIAHIRGGQDLGRDWYDQGRMMNKMNTFYDFIDCTKKLLTKNIGNKNKTYAMGGSAGGLLMGAIINLEPMLYKGIVSAVPFVDVLTTMSDESIPLTTFEYKEWGNPKTKKEYFYIKKYSPYDNIDYKPYPSVLVTSSLYDSQVQYFEPAKYVPKLREYSTSKNPILLKMNMIGGHAGKSGRLESLKETAEELGFLKTLAIKDS
ncbi:MAG: prolyl oligopeptidase family serine peptidase [Flavobacteriales bacterium]